MNVHPIQFFHDHGIVPRQQQEDVIDKVHKDWKNYKYVALSLPTGVGKTYIATAIADSVGAAYMLTSTLQLQTQYERSWEDIVNLKGRGNYTCALNSNFTVDAAPCSANSDLLKECRKASICTYYNQRELALKSRAMITNPVYMLYSAHCGFAKESDSPWVKRKVMVIDEAHNIESHLVQFAESDIDPQKYHEEFGVRTGGIVFTGRPEEDYMLVLEIKEILMDKALALSKKLEEEFPQDRVLPGTDLKLWAKGFNDKAAEKVKKLNSKIYALDKVIQPLKIFFNTHSSPEELTSRWIISKHPEQNVLKLAPIYGDFLFHAYFGDLAEKFVFLSATLGTKHEFCKELGIPEGECLFVETGSPFPPENSPVIAMPSIKLSKDHYEQNVKKVGGLIDEILETHKGEKGIIHSVTYNLQQEIFNRVSQHNRPRLLCRDMDVLSNASSGGGRYPKRYKNEELLALHSESEETVLVSPSMMEGVDLADDLARFQVIIKLPWANLGDVRVRTKSNLDPAWYKNKMWLNVLQASGRSTRHDLDTSVTYILDEKFSYFYREWERNLPAWFKSRLVF